LKPKTEIFATPANTYPYRTIVIHEIFSRWVDRIASNLVYKNFKSEVVSRHGYEFAHQLMKVWSAMHEVEDSGARKY
jgi:hypothetical protein